MNTNQKIILKDRGIKRSFFPRKKLSLPGLISHVTQRATGREPLFLEDSDYLYMLKLIKRTAEEFKLDVLAFALMTNHLHILFFQNKDNLTWAMHNLFTRYGIYFNSKYERKGHVFGSIFRQASCFDKHYLLGISTYIHLNPVRAGIVQNYSNYRWTTWRLYCQDTDPVTFVNWRFILSMINPDCTLARNRYRALLDEVRGFKVANILEDKRVFGKLGIWIKKRYPGILKNGDNSQYGSLLGEGYADDKELERIVVSLREKNRLRKPSDIKARIFLFEQLQARGYGIDEIAEYLEVSRATVYRALNRFKVE